MRGGLFTMHTTGVHWQLAAEFRVRHPEVDLRPDVLYVDDGDILTSAGSAAALDLALHIVRADHGAEIANHVSRSARPPTHSNSVITTSGLGRRGCVARQPR